MKITKLLILTALILYYSASIVFGQIKPPPQNNVLRFGGFQTAMLPSGSLSYTSQATLEIWIYLEAASPNGIIMGHGTSPALRFNASGFPIFTVNGVSATAKSALPLNEWTHLAGVRDAANIRLFVNGQEAASAPTSGNISVGGTFSIGGGTVENAGRADSGIIGAFRQARVWNRALSASEILSNAGIYLSGTEAGLIGYFPLDDNHLTATRNLVSGGERLQIGLRQYAFELIGEPHWTTPRMLETGPYFTATELPVNTQGQNLGGFDGRLIDFDSDGDLDALMNDFDSGSSTPQPLLAFRNDGNGNFTNASSTIFTNPAPTNIHARDYAIADFNGDGRMDAFMADHGYDSYPFPGTQSRILIQTPDGKLADETSTRLPQIAAFTHHVSSGDIDNDGDIDLYMCNLAGQSPADVPKQPRFYINNGNGIFTADATRLPESFRNFSGGYMSSELFDADNDNDLDLLLGAADYMGYAKDVLLLNNGAGNYTLSPENALPTRFGGTTSGTVEISNADVNNDGYKDLLLSVTIAYQNSKMQLLLNNRNGTFTGATSRFEQNFPTRVTDNPNGSYWVKCLFPTDFNKDGLIDFVASPDTQMETRYFINKGQGYFADVTGLMSPNAPGVTGIALPGDLDRDTDTDIFIASAYWGRYYVIRQQKNYPVSRSPFDFDGDGKTDVSIFRPSAGEWWYLKSSDGGNRAVQFGTSTDRLAPADYTGDGKTDIAFFRPSNGFWYVVRSEDSSYFAFPFGAEGDIPVPADYDRDGKADAAVYRPSTGTWFILNSSGAATTIINFGLNGDKPVPADYDGDGKTDIGVFRPSDGTWWHLRSSDNQTRVFRFGVSTDKPVVGDYTGDGKADVAVYRPATGEWFVLRSEDNSFFSFVWGQSGDIAAPGDYDGDGKTDASVFRPSGSTWFMNQTTAGVSILTFGSAGDQPVPYAFVR